MIEARHFIILSYKKDCEALYIHGIAERYDTQLQWEATRYHDNPEWCLHIPQQSGSKKETQMAHHLIVDGFIDFHQDLRQQLQRFDWNQQIETPFPLS